MKRKLMHSRDLLIGLSFDQALIFIFLRGLRDKIILKKTPTMKRDIVLGRVSSPNSGCYWMTWQMEDHEDRWVYFVDTCCCDQTWRYFLGGTHVTTKISPTRVISTLVRSPPSLDKPISILNDSSSATCHIPCFSGQLTLLAQRAARKI